MNDLEGRLYRANSKYNQQLTANSSLREEIETLRIKHRNFQNKDKKYQKGNYSNRFFQNFFHFRWLEIEQCQDRIESLDIIYIEPSKMKHGYHYLDLS